MGERAAKSRVAVLRYIGANEVVGGLGLLMLFVGLALVSVPLALQIVGGLLFALAAIPVYIGILRRVGGGNDGPTG